MMNNVLFTVYPMTDFYAIHLGMLVILFHASLAALIMRAAKATVPLDKKYIKQIFLSYFFAPVIASVSILVFLRYWSFWLIFAMNIPSFILIKRAMTTAPDSRRRIGYLLSIIVTFVSLVLTFLTYHNVMFDYAIDRRGFIGPLPYYWDYIPMTATLFLMLLLLMKKHKVSYIKGSFMFVAIIVIWASFPVPYYLISNTATSDTKYHELANDAVQRCLGPEEKADSVQILGHYSYNFVSVMAYVHNSAPDRLYNKKLQMFHINISNHNRWECFDSFGYSGEEYYADIFAPWPPY